MTHPHSSPVPRAVRWLSSIAAATLLAACASQEPRLYTLAAGPELNAPATQSAQATMTSGAAGVANAAGTLSSPAASQPIWIEVAPVRVPERLNRKQLVVRDGVGDALTLLEMSRWSAPLPDELRDALSQRLQVVLGAVDVYQQGLSDVQPLFRITTEVIRMDAELGQRAAATINWTVRRLPDGKMVAGRTQADLPAPGGVDGVVAAYRQAVNNTAADIAAGMETLRR